MKVIGWLSEREGLRESSGESVIVIGWTLWDAPDHLGANKNMGV